MAGPRPAGEPDRSLNRRSTYAGFKDTGPGPGETRELARLKLAANYSVENTSKLGGRLSDLDMNLRIMPKDYMAFGGGMGIDPNSGRVNQAVALFSIFDPRPMTRRVLDQDFMRPNSLDVSYRFIRRGQLGFFAEDANINVNRLFSPAFNSADDAYCDQHPLDPNSSPDAKAAGCKGFHGNVMGLIGIRSLYHLTDHLLLLYDATYNAQRSGFTTNRAGIKLLSQCECWSITLSVNRSTNPNETNFKFQFDLLGLSSQSKPTFR